MILVVDEAPESETSLDFRLRCVGYQTSHVNSARKALDFVRKYPRFEPLMIVIDRKISEREGSVSRVCCKKTLSLRPSGC